MTQQVVSPTGSGNPTLLEPQFPPEVRPGAVFSRVGGLRFLTLLSALLCGVYMWFLYQDLSPFLFHPDWTTDDALQQTYPFHEVQFPHIFAGDLITTTMKGYLAPIHWWLHYGLTWLCGDPIMASHWVMAVQLGGAVVFLFLAVRFAAGTAPAFFAVAWLLHTRPLVQRVTGGLPRGWSPLIFAAFLYFLFRRKHGAVLLTLAVGSLTNPPATLIAALAYGMLLVWEVVSPQRSDKALKPLLTLIALSPLYIGAVLYVVQRPEEVGQMVDFATASAMPEFQRPHGRFPFLPLESLWAELRMYAYQPFGHRLYNPGQWWKRNVLFIVLGFLGMLIWRGRRRKQSVIPVECVFFFAAIVIVYALSRVLAFKLYVPNRHLQIPMAMLLLTLFSVSTWRAFFDGEGASSSRQRLHPTAASLSRVLSALGAFGALGCIVWIGTGDGLYGTANFNYSRYKKGKAFAWLEKFSPEMSLIAGHPTHIDAVPLFARRRAFATTETTHPFYPGYYHEIKRRLEISLKAHYARDPVEFLALLEPEGIEYFVFSRKRFYPDALKNERFFSPLKVLVDELTSYPPQEYLYKKLPREVTEVNRSYMPFRDDQSVVIHVPSLRAHLNELETGTLAHG